MTTEEKKKRTNKPPVNHHKMEDAAREAGMTVEEFFVSEVEKHGSISAAARAHDMMPSAWQHWKKKKLKLTVEFGRRAIVTPKD